jgi:competence protein ComEC
LFDGGSTDAGAVGEYRIGPFLKQRGIALIDTVSVSHMDSDHYSGVLELLETMPVYQGRRAYIRCYDGNVGIRELVLPKVSKPSEEYLAMVGLCAEKNVSVRYVEAGEELYREDTLVIECLSPLLAKESENDTSLVFLLQTSELVVWLMGDAGVSAEEELIERLGGHGARRLRVRGLLLLLLRIWALQELPEKAGLFGRLSSASDSAPAPHLLRLQHGLSGG